VTTVPGNHAASASVSHAALSWWMDSGSFMGGASCFYKQAVLFLKKIARRTATRKKRLRSGGC
jgi:hypothetical protein